MLKLSSAYFRSRLGAEWPEGQGEYSAASPLELSLQDTLPGAVYVLCQIAHCRQDVTPRFLDFERSWSQILRPSYEFLDLAEVADRYHFVQDMAIQWTGLMSSFANLTVGRHSTLQALLHQVSAAFLLDQQRMFALFTRRLVLMCLHDTFSQDGLKVRPQVFASARLFASMSSQRVGAFDKLRTEVLEQGTVPCDALDCPRAAFFDLAVEDGHHSRWLKTSAESAVPLSSQLIHLACGEHPTVKTWPVCEHVSGLQNLLTIGDRWYICNCVNRIARGICLECLKCNRLEQCEHHGDLEAWVDDDPISGLQGEIRRWRFPECDC